MRAAFHLIYDTPKNVLTRSITPRYNPERYAAHDKTWLVLTGEADKSIVCAPPPREQDPAVGVEVISNPEEGEEPGGPLEHPSMGGGSLADEFVASSGGDQRAVGGDGDGHDATGTGAEDGGEGGSEASAHEGMTGRQAPSHFFYRPELHRECPGRCFCGLPSRK
jgi:hypothetical protein